MNKQNIGQSQKTPVRRARNVCIGSGRPLTKLIYTIVADHAGNKEGGECTAKLKTITTEAEASQRSVLRELAWLTERKFLTRISVGRRTHYLLHLPPPEVHNSDVTNASANRCPGEREQMTHSASKGDSGCTDGCHPSHLSTREKPLQRSDGAEESASNGCGKGYESLKKGLKEAPAAASMEKKDEAQPLPDRFALNDHDITHGRLLGLTLDEMNGDLKRFVGWHRERPHIVASDWHSKLREWFNRFAKKLGRAPVDPSTVIIDDATGKSFVVPSGFLRVEKGSDAGKLWAAFIRYLSREDCKFANVIAEGEGYYRTYNRQSLGLPADFAVLQFGDYFLVKTRLPPEPADRIFVEEGAAEFPLRLRYRNAEKQWSRPQCADLFVVGGTEKIGCWFTPAQNLIWVDANSPQWQAWHDHYNANARADDRWDFRLRFMNIERVIDGAERVGAWVQNEWPPGREEKMAA